MEEKKAKTSAEAIDEVIVEICEEIKRKIYYDDERVAELIKILKEFQEVTKEKS